MESKGFFPDEMYRQLLAYIALVSDECVRELLRSIVTDDQISAKLKIAPAALRIHHAWRSGMLEHIVSMCELAVPLSGKDRRLSLDWLIAGAILHDLGKIDALALRGVGVSYTTCGQLLEHVALGLGILERFTLHQPALPAGTKAILQHLIVNHHGDPEKGALRRPMTPEAIALSILDLLDARLEQAFSLLAQAPAEEEFTAYIPSLERQLYRPIATTTGQQGGTT